MRTVEQYFVVTGNGTGTLVSGTADVELSFNYQFSSFSKAQFEAPSNGECSLALVLTTASSTAACTVSAKNLYGNSDIEEESYWDVETLTATTSGVNSVNMLHITNSSNYDPNATGLKVKIARTGAVDLTYSGRMLRA